MLRYVLVAASVLGGVGMMGSRVLAEPPRNLGFEEDLANGDVAGWFVPPVCRKAGWEVALSEKDAAEGKRCAVMSLHKADGAQGAPAPFGNLMQGFDAAPYRGKRIVVTVRVKLGAGAKGRAQPWIRVDRAGGKQGLFDNCGDRPVMDKAWMLVTLAGNVDEDAALINIGVMAFGGEGPVFVDDVSVRSVEKAAVRADPPRELTARGLANLEAATRALGYVRHYYPGDEAAAVDWERFAVDTMLAAEPAESAEQLAETLSRLFAPVAPAMRFSATPIDGEFAAKSMVGEGEAPKQIVSWRHRGFNPERAKTWMVYASTRVERAADDATDEGEPSIGEAVTRGWIIAPGQTLYVRMPIVLYKDAQGTLPHPVSSYAPPANAPELSASDRATRLAGVSIAWNVLEHHYPYFEEVNDDWNAALREALRSAATDADDAAYLLTLQKLTTHLHDGHGYVGSKVPGNAFALPLSLTFLGDDVVVENAVGSAVPKGVLPGDVVMEIDGTPAAELVAFARLHEPAATEGHFHTRAARRIRERATGEAVVVKLRSPEGVVKEASLKPVGVGGLAWGRSGPVVSEKRPGIWYIDLDRATDKDLAAAMPSLKQAAGIVFDMRGYPNQFSMGMLGHFSDTKLSCARWEIPLANRPDRERLTFAHSRWDLPPLKPRLTARTAFVTDGRAISAAETFLGIVEHYKLAEIVGEPTAGTNGNINTIKLPAGFTITFTGMKVLKHDGSRHHGIGIIPTVPVHRTIAGIAAGRDELLERAMDAVGEPVGK